MLKRTISLLLCLCMVLTFAPAALAEETDTTVTVGEALPEETPSEATDPLTGEEPGEQTEPVQTEEVPQETEAVTEEITVSVEGITTDAATASGTHGTNVTWKVENETLTISGTGAMEPASSSQYPWSDYDGDIQKIVVGNGITTISSYAFQKFYNLAAVSLPNTLTNIGYGAFTECDLLNSVTIPGSVKYIDGSAFENCDSLEVVTIQNGVEHIYSSAFKNCIALKEITIPNSVKDISQYAFQNCTELTAAYIGNGVTEIQYDAFSGCTKLTSVTLGTSLKTIGSSAFSGCKKLKSISIPKNIDTINNRAFENCVALETVTLQNGVSFIGSSAFKGCQKLQKVVIPESVSSLGMYSFQNCIGLVEVTINGTLTVSDWGIFEGCTSLKKVVLSRKVKGIPRSAFKNCSSLTDITFGENITEIDDSAFSGCAALTKVFLPDKVVTIGNAAFENCTNLTLVDCGQSLEQLGGQMGDFSAGAFQNCTNLKNVIFPQTLELIGSNSFWQCKNLTDIYYQGTEAQWNEIPVGSYAFGGIGHTVTIHYNFNGSCVDTDNDHRCDVCQKYLVNRISGDNRYDTAILVADQMKTALNVEKFDAIIVASGSNFADALAGSYLSAVKKAPVLLSFGQGGKYGYLDTNNINYIKKNLNSNGTVYILGGENAVPALYVNELPGFNVKRLGGGNRFDTNLQILREAGVNPGDEILVCTGYDFADSLSAAATGKPILLVYSFNGKHYGIDSNFLGGLSGCSFTIIGGENAVGSDLATALSTYGSVERLAGGNRFETSTMVAKKYFQNPTNVVLAYAWEFPDGLCGGALAYAMGAPLILTMNSYEGEAVKYAKANNLTEGVVLGGKARIADVTVERILG